MDCPNCNFINMPDSRTCANCGSRLVLDDIDVAPPRARSAALPLPVRASIYRARLSIRDEARLCIARAREVISSAAPPAAIAASILPGGGHFLMRHWRAGLIFLIFWLIGALGVIYTLGTQEVLLPFGLMVGTHCLSISFLISRRLAELALSRRILIGFLISLTINLVLYAPLYQAFNSVILAVQLRAITANPTFLSGDVIWVEREMPTNPLRRGDIVVRTVIPPPLNEAHGVMVRGGVIADRIIGIPGDVVSFDDQLIAVNGRTLAAGQCPLAPVNLIKMNFELGEDEYIIVPSTLLINGASDAATPVISRLSRTNRNQILGRVMFRIQPLDRIDIFPRSTDITPPPHRAAPAFSPASSPATESTP